MVWIWLAACGTDEPTRPTPPATDDTAATDTAATDTAALPGTADTAAPLAFATGPAIRENLDAGLTAWLDVVFDEPAELRVEVEAGSRHWIQVEPAATSHEVLLLGLVPDADVVVTVTGLTPDGRTTPAVPLVVHAPPLPEGIYVPLVTVHDASRVEPGHTLTSDAGFTSLITLEGEVVWYKAIGAVDEVFARDGHLWLNGNRDHIEEWDLAGRRIRRLATSLAEASPGAVEIELLATHHDLHPLPDGNLLTLDVERAPGLYPTSEVDRDAPKAMAWVEMDVVTELTPDGVVVSRWPLRDLLDPERIGYNSVSGDFWFTFDPWAGDQTRDWGHGNAVSYDPVSDDVLVSLRHQDAIVAFSRTTGALSWIIAPPANWREPWASYVLRPVGPDLRPPYHQHAAKFTPTGTVMYFDNGNYQASAFEPKIDVPVPSRAVEVRPDPASGTYEVVWSFGEVEPTLFCPSLGDADPLPITQNVLVTFGNPASQPARIREVARDGTVVWEATQPRDGTWYRSQRITGLFPWEP